MRQKLEWAIKCLIYLSFLVPLIVIPSSFVFPFIVPKAIFFRILVEIMIGLYVLLLMINWRAYKITLTPITISVLLFYVVSFGISTFFGINAYHSFWDNHERMLGFFTILHYVGYYLIASQIFKTWTSWKWALRFFMFAGTIVMFVAFLQTGDPYMLMNNGVKDRVASTLGNPIYVGGFSVFLLFAGGLLMAKDKNRIWKYIYAVMMFLAFMGIFWSGTRGSLLALVGGVATVLGLYLIAMRGHKKIKLILLGIFVLLALIMSGLYINRQSDFVKNTTTLNRLFATDLTAIKGSNRWLAWEISWIGFVSRPVFGWGPNNFFYVFNQYYNPKSLEFGYGETWFDNAHNIVMNTLAVQGGFGIITYVGVFGVGFFVLARAYKKQEIDLHLFVFGGGFLVAHFIGNVTVFENITSYLYFMFWLAMLNSLTKKSELVENKNEGQEKKVVINKDLGIGPMSVVGVIVLFMVFIFNIRPAQANIRSLDVIKLFNKDPLEAYDVMVEVFQKGTPHVDDIRSDSCRTASQFVNSNMDRFDKEFLLKLTTLCYEEMEKNVHLHPLEVRVYMTLSQLAQTKAYLTKNNEYIGMSIHYLEKAIEISPRRQQVLYSLAMIYGQIGQMEKAESFIEQAISDNPHIGESYWRLAYLYVTFDQPEKAQQAINRMDEVSRLIMNDVDNANLEQIKIMIDNATTTTKVVD